ncbi:MAG TPA: efflux RND transporter periplasmic adaptor subunit [Saprospiraceae bacterium]|nr:efflux RND transporter periplasmic adaptor subunit [Saprospiraceae bacterium]HNT20921.1 efflux RND transporter periplasmic adaptor subunit [Saprospiraceae bacterium]
MISKEVTLPGSLRANEKIKIYSRIDGYIKRIYVDLGTPVTKGQVLAEIDAPELLMQWAERNERKHAAYAQYLTSKDESERAADLARTPGTIPISEVIQARNKMIADSLNWEAETFSLSILKESINFLQIRSPFSGVVTARYSDEGELTGSGGKQHILELEANGLMRVEIGVPETYSSAVLKDKNLSFTVPSIPGRVFRAVFARRSNALTENTKSEIWQFDLANPEGQLKSGMYVQAKMKLGRKDSTFLIPPDALVTTQESQYLVGIRSDTTWFIPVSLGFSWKDQIEVFGGLSRGDRIVRFANDLIREGEKIKQSNE